MQIGVTQCTMDLSGHVGAGSWQGGDLQNAIADLPYPTCPLPCTGYTATVAAPANDRWWRMDNLGAFGIPVEVELNASDTCHVTWWKGTCPFLTPISCYTLLPNTPTVITPWQSVIQDTLFMQVSGIHLVGGPLTFSGCIMRWVSTINPTPFVIPTPVTCAALSFEVVAASSAEEANGQIDVTVVHGMPPYQIQWADGNTGFHRTGLLSGIYPFILTDSTGCQQMDTVTVGVQLPTGYSSFGAGVSITHALDNATLEIRTPTEALHGRYSITDVLGRTLVSQEMHGTLTSIDLELLRSQLVILLIRDAQGVPLLIRKLHL